MKKQEVIDIMSAAKNMEDWNKRSEAIFRAYDGSRPEFWYQEIITSGLFERKRKEWENQEINENLHRIL